MTAKQKFGILVDFTKREIQAKHQGTAFGILWMILTPCFLLAVYTFVFGIVFGRTFDKNGQETIYDYAIGLFIGISIYQIFAAAIVASPNVIISRPNFVKKVQFPLEVLPISSTLSSVVSSIFSLAIAIILSIIEYNNASTQLFLLIPVLCACILYSASISLFLSAICVYLRDISQVGSLISLGLMFASGIFYQPKDIPEPYYSVLKYNPIVPLIDSARKIVLWNEPVNIPKLAIINGIGLVAFIASYRVFKFLKRSFSDAL
ncbi:ABC transporter permease [Pelagicoccus mobilis]|uniref:Transport permease protein n=1 Tax=Pelagicoccus mobilis TaxID=415221 RepID=A0A934S2L2_9BACT|nr:ABC transporter permease [Pelagicoccus mobilis]MBK1879496.1 ABC transporter permease [Pelagicoccus mobilis]